MTFGVICFMKSKIHMQKLQSSESVPSSRTHIIFAVKSKQQNSFANENKWV